MRGMISRKTVTIFVILLSRCLFGAQTGDTSNVEAFLLSLTENAKEQVSNTKPEEFDFERYIHAWSAQQNKTMAQTKKEIQAYLAQAEKPGASALRKGLAKFYQKDYAAAVDFFNQAANEKADRLQSLREENDKLTPEMKQLLAEMVRALRPLGNTFFINYDFVNALSTYQQALKFTSKKETPETWAAIVLDMGQTYSEVGRRSDPKESDKIFNNAIQAFQQALTVFTPDRQPLQWAKAQNGLGATYAFKGLSLPKNEGTGFLQKGADALKQSLTVITKDTAPFQWAKTQNNLGSALAEIALRTGGEAGTKAILDAVKAYKAALEVRTREETPKEWAQTQNNLAAAYTYLKDWPKVTECYTNVLQVFPDNQPAYRTAVDLSQKVVFDFPLALKLNEAWVKSHPQDLLEKVKLVEKYFTTAQYDKCRELIAEFKASKDYSTLVYVLMDLLEVPNDLATQKVQDVPAKLGQLLATIKDQTETFKVGFNFSGLKYYVSMNEALKPYRDWLIRYFEAFENKQRDDIYVALTEVKNTFHLVAN